MQIAIAYTKKKALLQNQNDLNENDENDLIINENDLIENEYVERKRQHELVRPDINNRMQFLSKP